MTELPAPVADLVVELRVPRGESGDLHAGVSAVLERTEPVRRAEVLRVTRVRPSPADLYVTAAVRVTPATRHDRDGRDERAPLRERLRDGFGVIAVEPVRERVTYRPEITTTTNTDQ